MRGFVVVVVVVGLVLTVLFLILLKSHQEKSVIAGRNYIDK